MVPGTIRAHEMARNTPVVEQSSSHADPGMEGDTRVAERTKAI